MINLLPPELKQEYMYARRNVTLRRWAIGLCFGLIGVFVVALSGLFFIEQSTQSYNQQIATTEQLLKDQKLKETQARAKNISTSVKLAVDVLSKEILFSKLLTQITTVIPPNTSLTDLSISKEQDTLDIKAVSSDYTSATQLQVNLEDPANKIFSKADIQNITCSGSNGDPRYPCSITIKALFSDSNPYLFINKGAGTNE